MSALYVSTQPLITSLPLNDGQWYIVLKVVIPNVSAGQVIQVMAEQEITNPYGYLAYVGSVAYVQGIGSASASMASDIQNGNHVPINRSGAVTAPYDMTNVEVDLYVWAGSVYGNDPLTVEQTGYGRLSVIVN